jgi:alanine dehydrogenase
MWSRNTSRIWISSRCGPDISVLGTPYPNDRQSQERDVKIGVPREIKTHEYRVGLTPAGARELVLHGHTVLIEQNAGAGIGCGDDAYRVAGATVMQTADEIFAQADMVVKVKEPQPPEITRLRRGQVLFTYLHLAADKEQTQGLVRSGATCIAYETVTDSHGTLPLLAPMSEVAGRMAVQVGAHCLEREQGGAGILLGGVPGVPPAKVLVLGGGVAGTNAARMAVGLEASVTIIDRSLRRLNELDLQFGPRATTLFATSEAIEHAALAADLVIGAVLIPGAAAPKLLTRDMVRRMRPGSVLVDIAIDQGGCFETSRPTTHAAPTYVDEGVVHYCVTNMPGAVARTSTFALTNATLPFVLALAEKGAKNALLDDPHLCNGLNIHAGQVTHTAVAQALGLRYTKARDALMGHPPTAGGGGS